MVSLCRCERFYREAISFSMWKVRSPRRCSPRDDAEKSFSTATKNDWAIKHDHPYMGTEKFLFNGVEGFVIPAEAGIHSDLTASGLRGRLT